MRAIWIVPVIASILILGGIGMLAYAVSGNTTVENIGVNPTTTFIEIEVSDPDGLTAVFVVKTDGPSGGPALLCAPTITTSVILEFVASNFPATITVEDCDGRPGDITEWAIDSAGIVRCTSGSCLDVEITTDVNDNVSVDPGEAGLIDGATVDGSVQVDGGDLTITGESTITGNVEVSDGGTVTIQDGSTVEGNVIVSDTGSILVIEDASVDGNIETEELDSVTITGNTINGNIKSDNDGDVTITGNTVNGNIEIIDPTGDCSELDNTVTCNNSSCP